MPVGETVKDKAVRLLASGALRIHEMTSSRVTATIHGDTGSYRLGYHPRVRGGWFCTCAARVPCSHLLALWSVIDRRQFDSSAAEPLAPPAGSGLRSRTLPAAAGAA